MRSAAMRWEGVLAAVIGAMALLGSAGIARAGIPIGVVNLDRSDLLDVWGYHYCDKKVGCPYNGLRAVWAGEQRVYYYSPEYEVWYPYHTEVGIAGAWGYVVAPGPGEAFGALLWFLYEPDKVTRNSSQVGMNQRDELGLLIGWHTSESDSNFETIYSNFVTYADVFPGCAGSVGVTHNGDDAKWKVQCKSRISQIADELGLPGFVQTSLENLLGKAYNKPLRIRGHGPMSAPML